MKACSSDSISLGLGRLNLESRVSVHKTVIKRMSSNTVYDTLNLHAQSYPRPYSIPVYSFVG